jgi:hypothetical protein
MTSRFAPAYALTLLLSAPAVALADIPPPDGGTGTGGASSSGTGTSSGFDPSCNVAQQQEEGSTCQLCSAPASDTNTCVAELGGDYNYVCQHSSSEQVWCNGPARNMMVDVSGCALRAVPGGAGGAAGVALLGLALLASGARRSRRSRGR